MMYAAKSCYNYMPADGYFKEQSECAGYASQYGYQGYDYPMKTTDVEYPLHAYHYYNYPMFYLKGLEIAYARLSKAKKHLQMLPKDKPRCKICDKTFSRRSSLKVHVRSHTGEKPFKCTSCSKAFAQSANLVAHIRTHTGEKPYACSVCDKRFSQSSSVKTHMRTHTGERPYQCVQCGMTFAERSTLSKHYRVHNRNSVCETDEKKTNSVLNS